MWYGLVPHSHVMIKIRKDAVAGEVPAEERGVTASHQAHQSGTPVLGKGVSTTPASENQWDHLQDRKGCWNARHPS